MKFNNLFSSTLLFLFVISTFSNAQNWNLIWADEFDTNGSIDEDKWFHQTQLPNGYSWYNNELQHYTDEIENSNVSNGTLKIVAIKENYTDQGHTKPYTSARLNSKFAFTYGKVEVRAKLPVGQGTWPAIWTLGKNITEPGAYWFNQGFGTTGWPSCGEIDIMEHWGSNQNYVQSATHTPSSYGGTVNHGGQVLPTASTQFHTYGLIWNEDELIFSVDGVVHYTYNPPVKNSDTWPFDAEQFLLLNLAIASDISPTFQQGTLEIDYVRVFEPSSDPAGCMDVNATNYDSESTIQDYDEWGNILCVYESCDDIPEYGCIYAEGFGAFNDGFDASDCESYGGTPCEEEIPGCIDESANNYNADANIDDGSCEYPDPASGVLFSGVFGGTYADANTYTMPTGSESWAGFANEDASLYPFTFGEDGSITFTGSTDGASAEIFFRFEKNPYPDTEPSFNTASVTLGAESAEYTVNIPSQGGNTFSSFLLYVTTPDVAVTLSNVIVNASDYSGPVDVVGCMDANATNYDVDATVQGYDQWGNLQCVYASCNDIPEYGCIYADGFGAFNEGFDAVACESYGGTPCEDGDPGDPVDPEATSYCAELVSHFNIETGTSSEVFLTISNIDENNVLVSAVSANNDPIDVFFLGAQTDVAEVSASTIEDGVASLILTWPGGAPSITSFEVLWSKESTGGNWMLGLSDLPAINTTDTCTDIPVYTAGCTDENATNFNEDANVDDGSCEYSTTNPASGIIFSGAFGGTYADANTYTMPTGSESWAGFANEDASVYPFTFGEGGSITFTGSTDGASADVYFKFEYNPYPDVDPSYTTTTITLGADSADYTVDIPSQGANTFSSFLLYVTTSDVTITLSNLVVNTSDSSGPVDVEGCMDENATNFNEDANVDDGSCEYCTVPTDWNVIVTGSNHTIVIPSSAVVTLTDGNVLDHANVGVFYTNNDGSLACAGSAQITPGETVQIAAMGDDTTTPEVDGMVSGSDLVWMIADCYGNVYAANATYTAGPEMFTINGITTVSEITEAPAGPSEQELSFATGWSMFSTYMIAADMDLANLLAPIVEQVIIAKDYLGAAYLPEWNFNGVGDLTLGQGYQIKTTEATGITVTGDYAMPQDHPINLTVGWNMIGYLRTDAAAADAVLADINATGNLIIAKDYLGAAYLPEWNFNGIGDLNPGQAYQIKVNNADVLQYLSNDDSYRMSAIEVTENNVSHFAKVNYR